MHKHHIVFRSQGGLDFDINFKYYRGYEDHEGLNGPHRNRDVDLSLKRDMQNELYVVFGDKTEFTIEEIARRLGRTVKYFEKHFKRVPCKNGHYEKEDIIRKLMGGKLY